MLRCEVCEKSGEFVMLIKIDEALRGGSFAWRDSVLIRCRFVCIEKRKILRDFRMIEIENMRFGLCEDSCGVRESCIWNDAGVELR